MSRKVLTDSSNLITNVNWDLRFWKATNTSATMHSLGINGKDGSKEVAAFWIYEVVEFANLTALGTYKSWSLRLACDDDEINIIRDNLQRRGILGPHWRDESEDKFLRLRCGKSHVKDLIKVMDNEDEREWMESLCDREIFPFIYNGIANANPNPGYDLDEFRTGQYVAVEFTTHAIDFRTKKNPGGTFKYNFRMHSIYLVYGGRSQVSTPSRRKRGPDEWLISPTRTRKINIHADIHR